MGPIGDKQAQAGPKWGSDGKMDGGGERERERERERIISPALRYSSNPYTTDQAPPTFSGKFRQVNPYHDTTSLYSKRFFSHNVLICLSKLLC